MKCSWELNVCSVCLSALVCSILRQADYKLKAYQRFQECRAVTQIRSTTAEELEELLSDGLLGAETVVVPLWGEKNKMRSSAVKSANRCGRCNRWFFQAPMLWARSAQWLMWGKRSISFHLQLRPLIPPSAGGPERKALHSVLSAKGSSDADWPARCCSWG